MDLYSRVESYRYVTPGQLKACMPGCKHPVKWAQAFDRAIEHFDITDVALLFAHVGHESSDLTQLEENLNYSMLRLREVWPSRFRNAASAKPYARNPQALANRVYANRMGNGSEITGDGWNYRGQGPIQITGKYNVTKFTQAINDNMPLIKPEVLQQAEYGALSACWYFSEHVPEGATVKQSTKLINGGYHGLADRQRRFIKCQEVLG